MSTQTQTEVRVEKKIKYPTRYNVIIHNDDFTPMEFVVNLLITVFNRNIKQAKDITMAVHENNRAIAGTYFYEIAEQKTAESNYSAKLSGFPLKVTMEEAQ